MNVSALIVYVSLNRKGRCAPGGGNTSFMFRISSGGASLYIFCILGVVIFTHCL